MFTQKKIGFVLAAAIFFLAGSFLLPGLNETRTTSGLVLAPLGQNAPPELVIATTALGGFRGLLVNAVWWRARQMQIEGKYWELVQLYDWIGKLQPHMEEIWKHNAWNMAYNIVAELEDPDERWRWIWRAVETTRDKGMAYNPQSYDIPWEISWIFYQKMGREIDEYYMEYMHRFALMIERDWGSGELDLEALNEAPATRAELLQNESMADLVSRFQRHEIDLIEDFPKVNDALAGLPDDLRRRYESRQSADLRRRIRLFRQARVIRDRYKMDINLMKEMEERYAKMDWRLPEPHAIYWAYVALNNRTFYGTVAERADTIDARRNISFSIQQLYRRGTILYMEPEPTGNMYFGFNIDFIDAAETEFGELVEYYTATRERGWDSMRDGHREFMKEAMMMLYWSGQETRAKEYYDRLKEEHPSDDFERYSMEEYVLGMVRNMVEEWGRQNRVRPLVDGIIMQAYSYLAAGETTMAEAYETQARNIWEYYRDDWMLRRQQHTGHIPDFPTVRRMMLENILEGRMQNFPEPLVERLRGLMGEEAADSLQE